MIKYLISDTYKIRQNRHKLIFLYCFIFLFLCKFRIQRICFFICFLYHIINFINI